MFSFSLFQGLGTGRIVSDSVFPEVRNRFDVMLDGKISNEHQSPMNRRIQIRLNENAIRFFYYSGNLSNTLIESKYREIAAISLADIKETDNDILYLGELLSNKFKNNDYVELKDIDLNSLKTTVECLVGKSEKKVRLFFDFPFIDKWRLKGKKIKGDSKTDEEREKERWFVYFVRCCFLFFIIDFENQKSPFAESPIFEEVRNKLRLSMAYQLLCAKIRYNLYLFEGECPCNQEEYTLKAGSYADLLMNARINDVIPRSYYHIDGWFYNPEIELDKIVNTDASFGEKSAHLNRVLLDRIRDFFYSKHAVISAMGGRCWERTYRIYLYLITIFSVVATVCLLHFDITGKSYLYNWFFDNVVWWLVIAIFFIFYLLFLAIRTKSLSVYMPRVLVAISFGWLTAFISDDLVKSQLEISFWFTCVALCAVIILICVMLWGEAKHHSPYYCNKSSFKGRWYASSWKILPITIHSYFWALTMGVIMQFALYEGLLKNSNALSDIVYKDTFDTADNYIMHLNNFKDALVSYRQDLDGIYVRAPFSGVMKGLHSVSFMKAETYYGKSEITKMNRRFSTKDTSIVLKFGKVDAMVKKFDYHVNAENSSQSLIYGHVPYSELEKRVKHFSRKEHLYGEGLSKIEFDSITNLQLNYLDTLIVFTEEEIQNMKFFVTNNNKYDTLITWSCNPDNGNKGVRTMGDNFKKRAINKHFLSRKIQTIWMGSAGFKELSREKYIFPRMLILHALIVLIIAFVGQLVVSDRSVTEPL